MRHIENWFAIETTKGYVTKKDFEIIKNHLDEYLKHYHIIKKQKFFLIVVYTYMSTKELFDILKDKNYSKTYEIEKIAHSKDFLNFYLNIGIKYTIGVPY